MKTHNDVEIIEDDKPVPLVEDDENLQIVEDEKERRSTDIIYHEDGKVTVPLFYPLDVVYKNREGEIIRRENHDSFTFRRLNAGDVEAMEKVKSDFNKAKLLFSRLSGKRDDLYSKLDAKDMNRINGAIAAFLE